MRTQAIYYRASDGTEPVNQFIDQLPAKAAAKIDNHVASFLNDQPPGAPPPEYPVSSQLDGELRELRVRFARTRYRIFYQRSGNLIVLLHAIEKSTGQVGRGEIMVARNRMIDFFRRMDADPRLPPRAAGSDAPRARRTT